MVSLLLPNGAEYVVAYFACFKLGALAGPVNSLLKTEEMAYVVGNSEAKVAALRRGVRGAGRRVSRRPSGRCVKSFRSTTWRRRPSISRTSTRGWRDVRLSRDDEAIIIYTSGTTGKPKGCLLTHGNLLANARQIVEWLGFTEDDRLLTVMPLFHMNAVTVTTASALYAGGSTVVSPRFSASRFWQIVSDYGVTSFGSVATMLSMLLAKYPEGVPEGLGHERLRFAMCGSAPVPAEVMRRFEETFECLVIEGYGLSESTCRSTFNPPDARRRPGSCGVAIGNEMKRLRRGRQGSARRRARRDRHARRERLQGLLQERGGDTARLPRRLVPHGRRGLARRRGLFPHRRPQIGYDYPRWRKHLPARDRRAALQTRVNRGGGGGRRARRACTARRSRPSSS